MRASISRFHWIWVLTLAATAACTHHCASGYGLVALCGQGLLFDPSGAIAVPNNPLARILSSPACVILLSMSAGLSLHQIAALGRGRFFDVDQPPRPALAIDITQAQDVRDLAA